MPEAPSLPASTARMRLARHRRNQERAAAAFLMALAAAVFCGGITWGLPSRDGDRYLFGGHTAWSGKRILELTGGRTSTATQGADVDRDPLGDRSKPILLNRTEAERAEIVRRYRLFSYQPDEMVTFLSLAGMKPGQGDFDPKLYQYGGLWIYPVGALLRIAGALKLIHLTPDLAWYLDHPQDFARFYIVARLYVAAWGLVGAWAVLALTRRLTGSLMAGCIACFCYVMMPVVVNMAHEAKPHLPGAVLMLLSILATAKYVRTADRLWWFAGMILAGAAVGMVLAAWPILVMPLLAALLMRQDWPARIRSALSGLGIVVLTYFVSNPYVLIHLFDNHDLLQSNLGNTRGMFTFGLSGAGASNALRLIAQGTSGVLALGGLVAAIALAWDTIARRGRARGRSGWLLICPMLLAFVPFLLFAEDQPATYGRFAIFVDLALMVGAVMGGWMLLERLEWRPELLMMLGLSAAIPGSSYYAAFVNDATGPTSRMLAAELVEAMRQSGERRVGVFAESAPYAVPPVNLFDWRVVLLPKDYDPAGDPNPPGVIVRVVDRAGPLPSAWAGRYERQVVDTLAGSAPMCWAAKPFAVLQLIRR